MSWDAYAQAVVDVDFPDGITTLTPIGATGHPAPHTVLHIITAHNPYGQHATADANTTAQRRLLADLTQLPDVSTWAAVGRSTDSTHQEPSIAIAGMTDDAAALLGTRYHQDAIFRWTLDGLRVIPCPRDT